MTTLTTIILFLLGAPIGLVLGLIVEGIVQGEIPIFSREERKKRKEYKEKLYFYSLIYPEDVVFYSPDNAEWRRKTKNNVIITIAVDDDFIISN